MYETLSPTYPSSHVAVNSLLCVVGPSDTDTSLILRDPQSTTHRMKNRKLKGLMSAARTNFSEGMISELYMIPDYAT